MMEETDDQSLFKNLDWGIIVSYLALVIFGWFSIYSAVYDPESPEILDLSRNYGKQLLWIGVSLTVGTGIIILDSGFFSSFSYALYGVGILLLVTTLFFGIEVAGAKSWLSVGGFALQSSEIAKFTTALALVKYLNRNEVQLTNPVHVAVAMSIFLLPMGLVLLQNDLGTAIIYASFILVLFRQGLPGPFIYGPISIGILFLSVLLFSRILVIIAIAVLGILLYWLMRRTTRALLVSLASVGVAIALVFAVDYTFNKVLQPHQQERINVLLGKEIDSRGAGYNSQQSLIAIGAGGLTGKGFLEGTQTKYNFVPEQSTDFIFCTIGEEYGFIGSSALVLLFSFLLIRLILSAEKQKAWFPRMYGYCVFSIIFVHFIINIGMTIGLLPIIGIPLPFVSYGGSALLGFTLLVAIYLKLDVSQRRFYN
jgi:rod shape determining protein RodA